MTQNLSLSSNGVCKSQVSGAASFASAVVSATGEEMPLEKTWLDLGPPGTDLMIKKPKISLLTDEMFAAIKKLFWPRGRIQIAW